MFNCSDMYRFLIPFLFTVASTTTAAAASSESSIVAVPPPRGTPEYFASLRSDYKFRLVTDGTPEKALEGTLIFWPLYYQIDIRINPCENQALTGGRGDKCCSMTGSVDCQDSTSGIVAGPDMQIGYIQNAHISTCANTDFADDPNCGTYIEIHRSGQNPSVLADVKLANQDGAYETVYISTEQLCTGMYELWWVVRTRSGPYVQFKKNFQVTYPNCNSL